MSVHKYQEIWVENADGPSMCALFNGDLGWLVYLRYSGDTGFSSRNPDYKGVESAAIDYVLSNGQRDRYPASRALPFALVYRALEYFRNEGKPPRFVFWRNDSGDGAEIEFVP